uniref:Uncharacterized protein n=1 Tax=Ciona savignyi TaxID=51511 RepID=H2Z873_CIOSA
MASPNIFMIPGRLTSDESSEFFLLSSAVFWRIEERSEALLLPLRSLDDERGLYLRKLKNNLRAEDDRLSRFGVANASPFLCFRLLMRPLRVAAVCLISPTAGAGDAGRLRFVENFLKLPLVLLPLKLVRRRGVLGDEVIELFVSSSSPASFIPKLNLKIKS